MGHTRILEWTRQAREHVVQATRDLEIADDDDKEDVVWGPSGRRDEPEWFSDDKAKAPRAKAISSVGNTFANMMSGAWAGSTDASSPPPPNMNRLKGGPASHQPSSSVGLGFEVSDEYHLADTHCLDCSFDWFVPVEIEPGKYMFRISPTATNGGTHRYTEKEQVLRSRDSAFVTIS